MKTAAIAMAALCFPVPAMAQAYQCHAPAQVIMSPSPAGSRGPRIETRISGYLLAISWSPEFCRNEAARRDPANYQCNGRIGRFGFVLHGLWPQGEGARDPQWCGSAPRPSREDIRTNLCMTPLPWMIEHEWAKHGSCMARTPGEYYKTARILWDALRLPDGDLLARREGLSAGELRQSFAARNPAFPVSSIGLVLSDSGWLREIRLCYGRNFRPRPCTARTFGPRNPVRLKIWRGG